MRSRATIDHEVGLAYAAFMRTLHLCKRLALLTTALAALSFGCDKDSKAAGGKSGKSGLEIKLLDAGQEPRRALRYKLQVGAKDTMNMSMDMDMQMKMTGMPSPNVVMPTMVMSMSMEIVEKVSDDEVRYRFELTDISVKDRPGAMSGATGMLETQMKKLVGMKGSAVVNGRGINRDAKLEMPEGLDAQMKQMMSGTMQNMEQLSAPFPEEPVGKGARWELHQNIAQNGMKIEQVVVYELVELDGDTGKMTATVTQSAGRQNVEMPGMGSAKAELLDLKSSGSGSTSFNLAKLVPTSNIGLKSDYSMNVSAMGQEQTISAHLEMQVGISPAP